MKFDIDIKVYHPTVVYEQIDEYTREERVLSPYVVRSFEGTYDELDEELEKISKYGKVIGVNKIEE